MKLESLDRIPCQRRQASRQVAEVTVQVCKVPVLFALDLASIFQSLQDLSPATSSLDHMMHALLWKARTVAATPFFVHQELLKQPLEPTHHDTSHCSSLCSACMLWSIPFVALI